jgi:uncharacterized membrane protein
MKPWIWLKAMLVTAVIIGYPIVMHLLLTSGQWPQTTLFVGVLPIALLPLGILKSGRIAIGLLVSAALVLLLGYSWTPLLQRQEWLYLIQNIGMQGLMAWVFGRTLFPPHEDLITQLARRLHRNDFTSVIAAYTRKVTWAWTGFFLAMILISIVLFAAASLAAWSFFINVLYLPLLALMFVLEYAVRRYCLRGIHHLSIIKGIAVYWQKPVTSTDKNA